MEDIGGPSFSLHTAKTWKKNKGKRLVRSIAKKNRAADRRDNATVPLYVVGGKVMGKVKERRRKRRKRRGRRGTGNGEKRKKGRQRVSLVQRKRRKWTKTRGIE